MIITCSDCGKYISQDGVCSCGRICTRARYVYAIGEEAYVAEVQSAERRAACDATGYPYDASVDGLT